MKLPIRLQPSYREKVWGATDLAPWFPAAKSRIGEVWFTFDENYTDDGQRLSDLMREFGPALLGTAVTGETFPILVKFIFTSERLSIQVHPDDERALEWEGSLGKTEMWHVLRAGTDAAIGLGFREAISRERLREAALSGEIEKLMRWFPVRPGDTFFTAAGTVHAIGAGVALCEIQQNSDVTYRLYDYGRPRELHLDKGLAVASGVPHPGPSRPRPLGEGRRLLACCPYFAAELWEPGASHSYTPDPERVHVLIVLEGAGTLAGRAFSAGEVWLVPAGAERFALEAGAGARLLRTYVPRECGS